MSWISGKSRSSGRSWKPLGWMALCLAILAVPGAATEQLTLEEVLERYAEARGGSRWAEVETLEIRGIYATFSQPAPFTLIRRRGDLYRLDHRLLGEPAVRARDHRGPWWLHKLLSPEPSRVLEGPYRPQLEREAIFGPLLLRHAEEDVEVSLIGRGEVDGIETLDLELRFLGDRVETWHLDADTFLEVAVDSQVVDQTQLPGPMRQRAFFADFRPVDGLVLPFSLELEFGARLESMRVEEVTVDGDLDDGAFSPPS